MTCSLCSSTLRVESCHVGSVRVRLCASCMHSAGIAFAAWTLKRMREVAALQQRAEEERREVEASSDALFAEMVPRVRRKAG